MFHPCDIVSPVWPIGSALSNQWTAWHCYYRPLCGRSLVDTRLCLDKVSFFEEGSRLAVTQFIWLSDTSLPAKRGAAYQIEYVDMHIQLRHTFCNSCIATIRRASNVATIFSRMQYNTSPTDTSISGVMTLQNVFAISHRPHNNLPDTKRAIFLGST
jgi:hypothetical protein